MILRLDVTADGARLPATGAVLSFESEDAVDSAAFDLPPGVPAPARDARIEIAIGYGDEPVRHGPWWVEGRDFGPSGAAIQASALDLRASSALKAPRSRKWPKALTVAQAAAAIAEEAGLDARVGAGIGTRPVRGDLAQLAQSDLAWLRRAMRRTGLAVRVGGGFLTILEARSARATSSAERSVTLAHGAKEVMKWRVSLHSRPLFRSCAARYLAAGTLKWVHVRRASAENPRQLKTGDDRPQDAAPMMELPEIYPSRAEALAAATAAMEGLLDEVATLRLTIPGNPLLVPGVALDLAEGWPDEATGRWLIQEATHTIASGYRTALTAITPSDA